MLPSPHQSLTPESVKLSISLFKAPLTFLDFSLTLVINLAEFGDVSNDSIVLIKVETK